MSEPIVARTVEELKAAAWEHQDGKGFTVVLQLLQGQNIVMRINEPRDSAAE